MNTNDKVLTATTLPAWRARLRAAGKKVVVTNGCFDILHTGHTTYLAAARAQGDVLLVGVNADASVSANKGPHRPVNHEADRAQVLAALASVDGVCIFPERTATNFLKLAQPDVYVKGGDQNLNTVPAEELQAVEACGGKVVFAPFVRGKSTTALLEKISKL